MKRIEFLSVRCKFCQWHMHRTYIVTNHYQSMDIFAYVYWNLNVQFYLSTITAALIHFFVKEKNQNSIDRGVTWCNKYPMAVAETNLVVKTRFYIYAYIYMYICMYINKAPLKNEIMYSNMLYL